MSCKKTKRLKTVKYMKLLAQSEVPQLFSQSFQYSIRSCFLFHYNSIRRSNRRNKLVRVA